MERTSLRRLGATATAKTTAGATASQSVSQVALRDVVPKFDGYNMSKTASQSVSQSLGRSVGRSVARTTRR